jgi:DNA-directed RNA polymerase specialized sigma24 family protein
MPGGTKRQPQYWARAGELSLSGGVPLFVALTQAEVAILTGSIFDAGRSSSLGACHAFRMHIACLHRRFIETPGISLIMAGRGTQPPLSNDQSVELVEAALGGNATAADRLVRVLSPVIHARVARVIYRRRSASRGRDLRVDLEDMVQEVFAQLFSSEGKILKKWDPERGLSLLNFVGLVAQQTTSATLRTGKRNPWTEDPTSSDTISLIGGQTASHEPAVESRRTLVALADRLRERTSPLGMHYFRLLYVEQRSVKDVSKMTGAKPDALYAWRSRLAKILRTLRTEIEAEEPIT